MYFVLHRRKKSEGLKRHEGKSVEDYHCKFTTTKNKDYTT